MKYQTFNSFNELPVINSDTATILLTYNQSTFISKAINSVLTQKTTRSMTLIIHDDCSTDSTVREIHKVLTESTSTHEVFVISQLENQYSKGVNINAQILLRTKSRYVSFCEGDDYWISKNKLEISANQLDRNPELGLFHSAVHVDFKEKFTNAKTDLENWLQKFPTVRREGVFTLDDLSEGNAILWCSLTIRRDRVDDNILRESHGLRPMDWFLCALVLSTSAGFYSEKILAAYRIHAGNTWRTATHTHRLNNLVNLCWFLSNHGNEKLRDYGKKQLKKNSLEAARATYDPQYADNQRIDFANIAGIFLEQFELKLKLLSDKEEFDIEKAMILESKSYRIGNALINPFSWLKKLINRT
jgi:glycosyltransferase involved in cell wall biosynthesis